VLRQNEAILREADANRARRKVSSEDVLAAETQVRQAEAGLSAAKAALAQSRWNVDEIQVAQAAIRQAEADIRYQDTLIAQTRVASPVNGVVSRRTAHIGESVVQMRNELMTLVSLDTLYFEATAPETALPALSPGAPADVALDAVPGQVFRGELRGVIPVAEGASRSVRLRISLPRSAVEQSGERPAAVVGGFARAAIRAPGGGSSLTVPRSALIADEGAFFVFLFENGRARRREVRIAAAGMGSGAERGSPQDRIPVLAGVRPGDQVISTDTAFLADGAPVSLK
jgi:RND family efflux transporter MFP subunit